MKKLILIIPTIAVLFTLTGCATDRIERAVRQQQIPRVNAPAFRNDMDTWHYQTMETIVTPVGVILMTPVLIADTVLTPLFYGFDNLTTPVSYHGFYRGYGVQDIHIRQVLDRVSELAIFEPSNVSVAFIRRGQKVPAGYKYIVDMTPLANTVTGGDPDWTHNMIPGTEFYFDNPFMPIPPGLTDRGASQLFWQMLNYDITHP